MRQRRRIVAWVLSLLATVAVLFGVTTVAYAAVSGAPAANKNLYDNGDGTYTLSLSVTGQAESSSTTEVTKANVILVLDTSTSMVNNNTQYNGQTMSRLNAEKHVLTDGGGIIDSLLAQNVPGDQIKSDIIEVAIVNFGTRGTKAQDFTTNATTLKSTVNGLSASQGTNWQEGLMRAEEYADAIKAAQPNEEVYIIFLTDGEPTTHFNDYSVNINYAQEWAQANGNARTLVTDGYHFYGIFTWGSGNSSHYLSSLVQYAYTGSGNSNTSLDPAYAQYFTNATDTDALIEALNQITHDITESVGFTNVELEDGVTSMTTSNVKTSVSGDVTGVKYYRSGGSYGTADPKKGQYGTEWADAPHATINDDGEVDWDLGSIVLENGVTYTITFVVWPSQESLDLVADLNNGVVSYDSLTDNQKSQISVSGGKYSLKTNTDYPTVTYSTVTTTTVDGETTTIVSDPQTATIKNPEPVDLAEEQLNAKKEWEDSLDPSQREDVGDSVTLYLEVDGKNYYEDEDGNPLGVTLTEETNWTETEYIAIAPGIMVTEDSPAYDPNAPHVTYGTVTYAILETGHDYIFKEAETDKHFELTAYTHHPMLVSGTLKDVIFTKDASGNITGIESMSDMSDTISATNTLKGGINITKKVVDETGEELTDCTDAFDVTVTVTDPDGNALPTKTAADGTSYTIDYRIYYGENNPAYATSGDQHRSDHIYKTGTEFTETIYVGDTIRVVNVEEGSLFEVVDEDGNGYEYVDTAYQIAYGTEEPADYGDDELIAVHGNSASYAEVTNKVVSGDLEITKTVVNQITSPDTTKFTFTVDLKDATGAAIEGEFSYTIGETTGTIESGGTLQLAGGEKATISKIPAGATYTVTETAKSGYTTTVDGEETNKATGTITAGDTATAAFTNTYKASGSAKIKVTKKLVGRDWLDGEKYTFTLTGPNGVNESKDVNKANPEAVFSEINYTEADAGQTYTYTVSETGNLPGGITKSDDVKVTVKITDKGDGTLDTVVSYDNNDTITNKYDATGSVELEAIKKLEGRDWKEGESYTFTLKDADGNVLDEKTVSSNTKVSFDALEYTEEDMVDENSNYASKVILNYTIEETTKMPGGMTNSGKINVTVTLTDDGEGNITAKADYTNNDTITNTYKAKGEAVLEAIKKVEGASWPEGGKVNFTLAGEGGTLPETKTVTLSAPGKATFGAIKYTEADMVDGDGKPVKEKEFTYTISEDGFGAGWTGSGNITATVKVTDNGDGTLSTDVTYNPTTDTITNTYKAEGSVTLEAAKVLTGRDWQKDETFTFQLLDSTGKMLQEKTVSANGTVTFDPINYTEADSGKTYEYTITEEAPLPVNVEKSEDVKATVVVNDDGQGKLTADVSYSPKDKTITNTYTPTPVEASITVNKTIDDYIAGSDKTFKFTMTPVDGAPMPEGEEALTAEITTKGGKGTVTLDKIEYTKAGEYKYQVVETADQAAGWTYDSKKYEVTVKVTDDPTTGKLSAEVVYGDDKTAVDVHNKFAEETTEVTLHVDKIIRDESNSAQDGTFTFQLKNEAGEVIQTKEIATKDFKGTVDFDKIEFTKSGTYNYSIQETGTDGNGWDYDTKEYPVVITVSDNFETAKLESATTIDGESTTRVAITNVYKADPVTLSTIEVTKSIEDTSGSAPETTFEFTLATTDGSPMPEAGGEKTSVTGEGKATFGEITYKKVGTYNYTITETKGGDAGWQNDTTTYPVVVTVTDNGGKLDASVAYGEKSETSLTVTNTYDPEDATIVLEARKVVDDKSKSAPADETFKFVLTGPDGYSETVEAKAGKVYFKKLAFSKVGTYKYTITEESGSTAGFTYDTEGRPVTVTVKDAGKGKLVATANYGDEGEAVITNPYCAEPTSTVIDVNKQISGVIESDEDATFTFNLSGEGVDMTTSVTGEGTASFDEIKYTKAGTYYYTVTEVDDGNDDYVYDDAVYTVTVEVKDEGGKLVATPTYTAGEAEAEDITFVNTYVPEVGLKVTKTATSKPANGSFYKEGEKVEYKIVVTNTGECDLTDVKVDDELTGDHWTVETLAAGASETFTTSYKVTKADVKAGSVLNVVTTEADNPVDPDKPLKDKDKVKVPTGDDKTPPEPPHKKVVPQTGDETPTGAMALMTVFGAAALTAGTVLQRRKRK